MILFNIFFINFSENNQEKKTGMEKEIREKIENKDYKGAIELIINKYKKNIWNFVYFNLGSTEDAKDICQEIFFKVCKNLKGFKFKSSVKTWVYKIAINEIINFKKRREGRVQTIEMKEESIENISDLSSSNPEEISIREEKNYIIWEFLKNNLCEEQRDIVYLKFWEEFKWEEISEITKKNSGALRKEFSGKLKTLGVKIEEEEELCNIFGDFLSNKVKEEK